MALATGQPYAMLRDECTWQELVTILEVHNDRVADAQENN